MVFCQMRNISHNTSIDFVELAVILKVGMISENEDFILSTYEKVMPVFKAVNDCEQFPIMDITALFCFIQGFRMVGYWVLAAIGVVLV